MSDVVLFETLPLEKMSAEQVLTKQVSSKKNQYLALVTLNVEATLNSLSLEMIELLSEQLTVWRDDESIVAVFFQGAGDRAFCAGGDIQALYHSMIEHPGGPNPYADAFFEKEYKLDYLIHTYPKPTIAWAHGIIMGGGLGIMGACDYRIGTERTRIAMPEITIGLFPDAGATWLFSRMAKSWAYFIALTACTLNAQDALKVSLINHLSLHETKDAFIKTLLASNWSGSARDIVISGLPEITEADSLFPQSKLAQYNVLIENLMTRCFSENNFIASFAKEIALLPNDTWLEKAAQSFLHGSPTTAQIIERQFSESEGKSLKEMLETELVIAVQCARRKDFSEGVRALLIEKDNKPDWRYKTLGQVPSTWIDEHFTPPWDNNPLENLS
jgi:enoyl-CoA hydratase/carnithine racemase